MPLPGGFDIGDAQEREAQAQMADARAQSTPRISAVNAGSIMATADIRAAVIDQTSSIQSAEAISISVINSGALISDALIQFSLIPQLTNYQVITLTRTAANQAAVTAANAANEVI